MGDDLMYLCEEDARCTLWLISKRGDDLRAYETVTSFGHWGGARVCFVWRSPWNF